MKHTKKLFSLGFYLVKPLFSLGIYIGLFLSLSLGLVACSSASKNNTPAPLVILKVDAQNEKDNWKVHPKYRAVTGQWDIERFNTMFIEGKGDGQEYVFFFKDQNAIDNKYRYERSFKTKEDADIVIKLPFDKFKAVKSGKVIREAEPLDLNNVVEMGIRIKDLKKNTYNLTVNAFWTEML